MNAVVSRGLLEEPQPPYRSSSGAFSGGFHELCHCHSLVTHPHSQQKETSSGRSYNFSLSVYIYTHTYIQDLLFYVCEEVKRGCKIPWNSGPHADVTTDLSLQPFLLLLLRQASL